MASDAAGGFGVIVVIGVIVGLISCCCCGCSSSGGGSREKTYCEGPWAKITNQDDATSLQACDTYNGGVGIESSFTGSLDLGNKLTEITGDLQCISVPGLTSISANSLSKIGGSLLIKDLTSLHDNNLTTSRRLVPILESRNLAKVEPPKTSIVQMSETLIRRQNSPIIRPRTDSGVLPTPLLFPRLSEIDDKLSIVNNKALHSIDGFPNLAHVKSIEFKGSFSSLVFPSLSEVPGGANIAATSLNLSICHYIDGLKHSGTIKGSVKCEPRSGRLPTNMMAGVVSGAIVGALLIILCTILLSDKWLDSSGSAQEAEDESHNA